MATKKSIKYATRRFEQALSKTNDEVYVLRLYVTGATAASTRAIRNLRAFCEENLDGRFELEVVDIFQHPELAEGEQIIAAPTLIKRLPLPVRRFIGDLSDLQSQLLGFEVRRRSDSTPAQK